MKERQYNDQKIKRGKDNRQHNTTQKTKDWETGNGSALEG